jgi:hypothetical protein
MFKFKKNFIVSKKNYYLWLQKTLKLFKKNFMVVY